MEAFGHFVPIKDLIHADTDQLPRSLGNTFETKAQLSFLIFDGFSSIQSIDPLKTFKLNNQIFNSVRDILFFQSMILSVYDQDNSFLRNVSHAFEPGFIHLLTESQYLIEITFEEKGKDGILNSTEYTDPVLFANPLFEHISSVFQNIVHAISETCDNLSKVVLIIMILFVILFPICNFYLGTISMNHQNQNGEMIYRALMLLPKNAVSSARDQFKIDKKNFFPAPNISLSDAHTDTTIDRQEENLIKTFLTAQDTSHSSGMSKVSIMFTIFNIPTHITNTVLIYSLYSNMASEIKKEAPHIQGILKLLLIRVVVLLLFSYIQVLRITLELSI
jgi:hypothetical protein